MDVEKQSTSKGDIYMFPPQEQDGSITYAPSYTAGYYVPYAPAERLDLQPQAYPPNGIFMVPVPQQSAIMQPMHSVPMHMPPMYPMQPMQSSAFPVAYPSPYAPYPAYIVQEQPPRESRTKTHKLVAAAVVTYVLSLWLFVTQPASIAISLHMVRTGHIVKRKNAVIWLSMLELLGWLCVPTFSWYYDYDCTYYYANASWGYPSCRYEYWGWIAFIVWGVFTLAFGIPRVVFTAKCEREDRNAQALPVAMTTFAYSQ